jgi:hypothetical protein
MSLAATSEPIAADDEVVFRQLFEIASLTEVFNSRFAESRSKGVDRLSGRQYSERFAVDVHVVAAKCNAGSFRFSPYLENLKPRGRSRAPRLISIPTIRDRVVLHQLNRFLASRFPECVARNIASAYVRQVAVDLAGCSSDTFVCGCDIKTFYDSIHRERLLGLLRRRIAFEPAMRLLTRAIRTPTVPKSARRETHSTFGVDRGVPQGLAISNILASISLHEVDQGMVDSHPIRYFRYVDDVLMYGVEPDVRKAHRSLAARLRRRGLSLHPVGAGKTHLGPITQAFGYLGYQFEWPQVTVRETTVERLLQSLAAKFSEYSHNTQLRLNQSQGLTRTQLQQAFLLELNEKITGSVSGQRRYGWVAYFNQITDLSLLHRLDFVVAKMFERLPDFEHSAPSTLKKFSRSFFEMKYRPGGGYVQNYDQIINVEQMRAFLVRRAQLASDEEPSDAVVIARYDSYRRLMLRSVLADEGGAYG